LIDKLLSYNLNLAIAELILAIDGIFERSPDVEVDILFPENELELLIFVFFELLIFDILPELLECEFEEDEFGLPPLLLFLVFGDFTFFLGVDSSCMLLLITSGLI
jgi:hypothetical protein